ncbi:MAG TPA: NAD(P)H-hydrate epimerase [Elusimicrobiota bacterium]|nr:NAD(P)H-hydrate epimerase [Elusimicrobiota bacterium]
MTFATTFAGLPVVDSRRMREIEERAAREFGIPASSLMRNAGEAVARRILREPACARGRALVACGRGNNGGDGLVAARVLAEAGVPVDVLILEPRDEGYPPAVEENRRLALRAGVPIRRWDDPGLAAALAGAAVVLDCVLGTGARGAPSGPTGQLIWRVSAAPGFIAAVDIPSGLDPDTGAVPGAAVRAALTLALGLPKAGLVAPAAAPYVGRLEVLDIGLPPALINEVA